MKFARWFSLVLLVAMLSVFAAGADAEEFTLTSYLEGFSPEHILVSAYECVNPSGEKMTFDATPMDDNAGDVSDPNSNLSIAQNLFDALVCTEVEKDDFVTEERWRFAICYEIRNDADDTNTRAIRLDFYDYTNVLHITIYDRGAETKLLYEGYIQIPLEDSYAFEDVYLHTVAMLRRSPAESR